MELRGVSPQIKGERFPIQGRLRIGRKKSDVNLDDELVSFQHAIIVEKEGEYFIADTHSLSGTYINDQKLESNRRQALKPGDRLTFGHFHFEVQDEKSSTPMMVEQKTQNKKILFEIEKKKDAAEFAAQMTPPPVPIWKEQVRWTHRLGAGLTDVLIFAWAGHLMATSILGQMIAFFSMWIIVRSLCHLSIGQTPGEILFRLELRDKSQDIQASVLNIMGFNILNFCLNLTGFVSFWSGFLNNKTLAERMSSCSLVHKEELKKSSLIYRMGIVGILLVSPLWRSYDNFYQDPRILMTPEPLETTGNGWGNMNFAFFDLAIPWRTTPDLLAKLEYRKGPPERFWHEITFLTTPTPNQDPIQITVFGRRFLPIKDPVALFQAQGPSRSLLITDHLNNVQIMTKKKQELTRDDGSIEKLVVGKNNSGLEVIWRQWALAANRSLIELMFLKNDRQITISLRGNREQLDDIDRIASDIAARSEWREIEDQVRYVATQMVAFKGQNQDASEAQTLLTSKFSVDPKDINAYYTLAAVQAQMLSEVKDNPIRKNIIINNLAVIYRTMLDVDPASPMTKSIERIVAQIN